MKANGFSLGPASDDANIWVYWCPCAHGGNIVDKNDGIILNSPKTEQALQYAKQRHETMIQGCCRSAIFTQGDRPVAGKGGAAFWLPLMALYTA
jgi:hypothetical protein